MYLLDLLTTGRYIYQLIRVSIRYISYRNKHNNSVTSRNKKGAFRNKRNKN